MVIRTVYSQNQLNQAIDKQTKTGNVTEEYRIKYLLEIVFNDSLKTVSEKIRLSSPNIIIDSVLHKQIPLSIIDECIVYDILPDDIASIAQKIYYSDLSYDAKIKKVKSYSVFKPFIEKNILEISKEEIDLYEKLAKLFENDIPTMIELVRKKIEAHKENNKTVIDEIFDLYQKDINQNITNLKFYEMLKEMEKIDEKSSNYLYTQLASVIISENENLKKKLNKPIPPVKVEKSNTTNIEKDYDLDAVIEQLRNYKPKEDNDGRTYKAIKRRS